MWHGLKTCQNQASDSSENWNLCFFWNSNEPMTWVSRVSKAFATTTSPVMCFRIRWRRMPYFSDDTWWTKVFVIRNFDCEAMKLVLCVNKEGTLLWIIDLLLATCIFLWNRLPIGVFYEMFVCYKEVQNKRVSCK